MMTMTPMVRPTNMALSVRKVPSHAGTTFLAASDAAERQRGDHDAEPADQHVDGADDVVEGVLPVRPPKAEPLLFPCDVRA